MICLPARGLGFPFGADRCARRQSTRALIQEGVYWPSRRDATPASGSPSGKPRTGGKPETGPGRSTRRSRTNGRSANGFSGPAAVAAAAPASRSKPGGAAPWLRLSPRGLEPQKLYGGTRESRRPDHRRPLSRLRVMPLAEPRECLVQYQSRNGELALEREDGSTIEGSGGLAALATNGPMRSRSASQPRMYLRLHSTLRAITIGAGAGCSGLKPRCDRPFPVIALPGRGRQRTGRPGYEIVMSAAARRQGETAKAIRVFDNRKSLSQLEDRLDRHSVPSRTGRAWLCPRCRGYGQVSHSAYPWRYEDGPIHPLGKGWSLHPKQQR